MIYTHLHYNITKEYSNLGQSQLTNKNYPSLHWGDIFFQNSQWKIINGPRYGQYIPLKSQKITIKNEDCVELVAAEGENM